MLRLLLRLRLRLLLLLLLLRSVLRACRWLRLLPLLASLLLLRPA
jgi:hypothetical protein